MVIFFWYFFVVYFCFQATTGSVLTDPSWQAQGLQRVTWIKSGMVTCKARVLSTVLLLLLLQWNLALLENCG